jgi:hypothetical protein
MEVNRMGKRIKIVLTVAAVFLFIGTTFTLSSFANTVINFDTLPGGGTIAPDTIITTQYSSDGVVFSMSNLGSPVAGPYAEFQYASLSNPSLGNALWNCDAGCGPRADTITMTFTNPVSNVSWLVDSEGGLPITFKAYDSSLNLLETVTHASSYPSFDLQSFNANNIAYIVATNPVSGWGWSMDNLSYTVGQSTVPEPTSLLLLGSGFSMIGLAAWRKRK